ncbi:hypothetical protein ACFC1B_05780 [Streptomyces xiamenensis]|uniref:hypothetical protein n=1 Tax=Streptomyces xiamenensis TaxID=408015 RepID=UPI0035D6FC95
MTRRRTRTALIAASAATALLLTACGGSDNGDASNDIPGVDETTEEPGGPEDEPEESAEEEPGDGVDHPEIDFGDDYQNTYEDDYTGDPVVDAVLRANQGFNDAVDEAIIHHDYERPALGFYISGPARTATFRVLDAMVESGESSGGTSHYFNRDVKLVEEGVATISFCRDFSQVYDKDFETGEITKEADPDAKPTLYVARMELSTEGVWQTVEYDLSREDQECQ